MDFGLGGELQRVRYRLNFLGSGMTLILPGSRRVGCRPVSTTYAMRWRRRLWQWLWVSIQAIVSGLTEFRGVKGRLQKNAACIRDIDDDSYNANPESVRAALAVLAKAPGKKILVLGDMGELGDTARDFHERIGEEARLAGIDGLFALGELSAYAVAKFGSGARHFDKIEELLAEVRSQLAADVTFLIKGSRFMQMERVVKHIEL